MILNAICISLHAFCHGTRGLSLEDEWECPVPPGRGRWAKRGNGPEEELYLGGFPNNTGKVSRSPLLVKGSNHTRSEQIAL